MAVRSWILSDFRSPHLPRLSVRCRRASLRISAAVTETVTDAVKLSAMGRVWVSSHYLGPVLPKYFSLRL